MHPALIAAGLVGAAGIGTAVVLRAKKPAAIAPATVAAANAQATQDIKQGLATGAVRLGTNGVPFQAIPTGPPSDPSAIVKGLTDPGTGLIGILPKDQLTVDSTVLAQSLQLAGDVIPNFAPHENILFQVTSSGQIGNMTPDPASGSIAQGSTGPIVAESRDPKFNPGQPIQIPLAAITGVQPPDAAAVDAKLAAQATKT